MIPQVVASERGAAQTDCVARRDRGSRTALLYIEGEWKHLESCAADGESPVHEVGYGIAVS